MSWLQISPSHDTSWNSARTIDIAQINFQQPRIIYSYIHILTMECHSIQCNSAYEWLMHNDVLWCRRALFITPMPLIRSLFKIIRTAVHYITHIIIKLSHLGPSRTEKVIEHFTRWGLNNTIEHHSPVINGTIIVSYSDTMRHPQWRHKVSGIASYSTICSTACSGLRLSSG